MAKKISNKEIQPGDTIIVSRKLQVGNVRDYSGASTKAVLVNGVGEHGTSGVTILVFEDDSVELIERKPEIPNPETALFIWWQDDAGMDYYARKDDGGRWITDSGESYPSIDELIKDIAVGEFRSYKQGSLQVIKRKHNLASGSRAPVIQLGDFGGPIFRNINVVS